MTSGKLWRILGLCFLSVGAWGQEGDFPPPLKRFKVSISGTRVEVTCPEDPDSEQIKWERNGVLLKDQQEEHLLLDNFSEMENSGHYTCYRGNSNNRNHLYLKARVCENCMEVDVMAVAGIIVADVCVTLGLLLLVYYWSKNRKAKAKPMARGVGAGGRPGGQNKERPPPVPNPDYEPIRKGQRELYSGLNQRGV
ncbi:T-cell surface glycoprotein CD3 epsilon chain [Myotis daubentonii]|uniref:T-cell surface glycoprotein CD3 epsilon chain n=1 Tax=Myotis daubentonii TaxID=98922 RepID=UPI00287388AE|nr:T-cell surface glycoprotein CD3 epsilon chain [Myotis daubentonii]XP_059563676.1 T-cell surface glycoprotein CD3 epsilon chain [Myotis daubentonii]